MVTVNMEFPDEMIAYVNPKTQKEELVRNAMILYPYIQQGVISHGKVAEILGIFKMDLITLYGRMGLSYIKMSDEEIQEELETINELRERMV